MFLFHILSGRRFQAAETEIQIVVVQVGFWKFNARSIPCPGEVINQFARRIGHAQKFADFV